MGKAIKYIQAREYAHISPVFNYNRETGEVLELSMAAITNYPALDGMKPLAV